LPKWGFAQTNKKFVRVSVSFFKKEKTMVRPTNIYERKNRIHSICLNEKAEQIFRDTCKIRGNKKWLHRFVIEKLIVEFGDPEKILIKEITDRQTDIDNLEKLNIERKKQLDKLRGDI